jgi:aminoglycoside phosphotransferase (APT) family kinase protein
MHPNQLTISPETVRRLVDAQFPRWRDLPVEQFASQGTVNALFRIGQRLAARFRTPEPVALGDPGRATRFPGRCRPGRVHLRCAGHRRRRLAGSSMSPGLGSADSALDLVGAWHLLEAGPRQVLRDDLNCDDLEWEHGKAWAFEQAMGAGWYYVRSNPAMSLMGRRTLQRIMADTSSD